MVPTWVKSVGMYGAWSYSKILDELNVIQTPGTEKLVTKLVDDNSLRHFICEISLSSFSSPASYLSRAACDWLVARLT